LYSRFIVKVLHDAGHCSFREPFGALFTQGMICKRSEKDGKLYKMSKSKGNVVSPDELIEKHGADTVRLYTLFIGPPEKDAEWSDQGIEGAVRFLRRLWRRVRENMDVIRASSSIDCDMTGMNTPERDLYRKIHETISDVTQDIEGSLHFNSAIAAIMELMNALDSVGISADSSDQQKAVYCEGIRTLVILLSPFAPHISEELWHELGNEPSILSGSWPECNSEALVRGEVEIVIQVNGKVRGRLSVDKDIEKDALEKQALASAELQKHLEGKTVRKVVVVPKKLVNIVVS
jgi:leucyl-tRNA synthetase